MMSELNLVFQNRSNVTQAAGNYQHIPSFAQFAKPSLSLIGQVQNQPVRSELSIGLELARIDEDVFNSKPLLASDHLFLDKVSRKFNAKNPLKFK